MVPMFVPHVVRLGRFGQVGRLLPVEPVEYPRGCRVICRTRRGLEVGEVLACSDHSLPPDEADGQLLRRVTVEDDLLIARLTRLQDEAFAACQRLLAERQVPAVLMEVEHLFDGQSLYFYFLGPPPAEAAEITADLAAEYDATVRFRQFAETLEAGCGPDCGTAAAAGCGTSGGCASCSLAAACAKH